MAIDTIEENAIRDFQDAIAWITCTPSLSPCRIDLRLASQLDHNCHISALATFQKKQKRLKCRFTVFTGVQKCVKKGEVPAKLAHLAEGRFSLTGRGRYLNCFAKPFPVNLIGVLVLIKSRVEF